MVSEKMINFNTTQAMLKDDDSSSFPMRVHLLPTAHVRVCNTGQLKGVRV